MKVDVLDINGKTVESIDLDKSVFEITPNEIVLAQYTRVFGANQRQGTSASKTRAEVSGSGKKPWKQKKTGRARHGSKRSPLWRHGGIVHGPKPKSWTLALPKKIKQLAVRSALSKKATTKKITVLKELALTEPKTAEISALFKKLNMEPRRTLLILGENDLNTRKSAANVKGLTTSLVDNLNAFEVLLAHDVIFEKNALVKLQEKYAVK